MNIRSYTDELEILCEDPLRPVTRAERKYLLIMSVISIAVCRVGLFPQKINALGIEFTSTNKTSLLVLLAAAVCYFLISFVVYGLSDYSTHRTKLIGIRRERARGDRDHKRKTDGLTVDELEKYKDAILAEISIREGLPSDFGSRAVGAIHAARQIMELVVPVATGSVALIELARAYMLLPD